MPFGLEYVIHDDLRVSGPSAATDSQISTQLYLARFGEKIHLVDAEELLGNIAEFKIPEIDVADEPLPFVVRNIAGDKARGECCVVEGLE